MNQIRFCNVHRENDKVTKALRATWMKPEDNQDDLPLVGVLARRLNSTAAFEFLERPSEFSTEYLYPRIKEAVSKSGRNTIVNTAAYKVAGLMGNYEGAPDGARTHSWALSKLTEKTSHEWYRLAYGRPNTLKEAHEQLLALPGVGSFIGAQVVADLKHTQYLKDAPDWWTWAAPGPGSIRGLNWYFDGDEKGKTNDKNFLERLHQMEDEVTPLVMPEIPRIGAQDWQNICCEFDKWNRFQGSENTGKQYRSR
jgi:alkylated DNA nucleotide flippase Atl1